MTFSAADLFGLARFTLIHPRAGARLVMSLNLPAQARWLAIALVSIGTAFVTTIEYALLPVDVRGLLGVQAPSPLLSAGVEVGLLSLVAALIHWIGRFRGGQGSYGDALVLVAWLQFLLLGVEALQLVLHLILPALSDAVGVAGILLMFWLLTHFVAELHGFRSIVAVLGGILLALVLIGLALGLVVMSIASA